MIRVYSILYSMRPNILYCIYCSKPLSIFFHCPLAICFPLPMGRPMGNLLPFANGQAHGQAHGRDHFFYVAHGRANGPAHGRCFAHGRVLAPMGKIIRPWARAFFTPFFTPLFSIFSKSIYRTPIKSMIFFLENYPLSDDKLDFFLNLLIKKSTPDNMILP